MDDNIKRVVRGEKVFQDCQVERQNLDCVLHVISRQLSLLERDKKVVRNELGQMECGRGVSFWPKPILHSKENPLRCTT